MTAVHQRTSAAYGRSAGGRAGQQCTLRPPIVQAARLISHPAAVPAAPGVLLTASECWFRHCAHQGAATLICLRKQVTQRVA